MANFGHRDRAYRQLANKSDAPNDWRLQLALPKAAKKDWDRLCAEWGQPPRVVFMALVEALDRDADLRGEVARIFEQQRWETRWTTWGETPHDNDNTDNGENNA